MRHDQRPLDQLRNISITRQFTNTPAGSVLWKQGNTIILANASIDRNLPPWFGPKNVGGWLSCEYVMLPASTPQRKPWPKVGHTDGRGTEIQRLIGRSLRAAVDLSKLGPHAISIDCQVLQADGGTRTASICAGFVALRDAINKLPATLTPDPKHNPLTVAAYDPSKVIVDPLAAVSVGIVDNEVRLDLDYLDDSAANVDMNLCFTKAGKYIEIQAAAENGQGYTHEQLLAMLSLGKAGCEKLLHLMGE
jgi:ribonuclease PH